MKTTPGITVQEDVTNIAENKQRNRLSDKIYEDSFIGLICTQNLPN